MTNLISGKEALIALANGKTVEVKRIHDNEWQPAQIFGVSVFTDSEATSFRLKPHTITINGIEVPCNKSKHDKDDVVWVINTACENWYDWIYGSDCNSNTLYWETEEEIKQVVAALRQIFREKP